MGKAKNSGKKKTKTNAVLEKTTDKGVPNKPQDNKSVDYGKYLEDGTRIIIEIISSQEVDDEEKRNLIDTLSDELERNIGNTDKLRDVGPLLYGVSLKYLDGEISKELTNNYVTEERCEHGIRLCQRQQELLNVYNEHNWNLPEINNFDMADCVGTFQDWREGLSIGDRLSEEDRQLDFLIDKAGEDISTEACDLVLDLVSKVEADAAAYEEKGFVLSNVFKKDTGRIREQIGNLRLQAEKKETLYEQLHETDYEIHEIASRRGTTEEQWQIIMNLCQKQSNSMDECGKKGWPLPTLYYSNLEDLRERFGHYFSMVKIDRLIASQKEVLSVKSRKEPQNTYDDFYDICQTQGKNIEICKNKSWDVPKLLIPNPIAVSESIRIKKEKENKGRSIRLLTVFAVIATISVIVGFFAYRHGKVQIPFNSSYVKGGDADDLYAELEKAGFENISKKEDGSGWLKDGEVTHVSIEGSSTYGQGDYKKPDVDVVIYCSSKGRKDISKELADWRKMDYEALGNKLNKAGFSNLSFIEENTYEQELNLRVSSVSPNGEIYTNGSCFIPPKSPIVIRYYILKIKMEKAAAKFVGNEYSGVVAGLRESGFTNIELQRTDDLKLGVFKKEGEIRSIRINGDSSFDKDAVFNYYDKVVIVVNTFQGRGCSDITIIAN